MAERNTIAQRIALEGAEEIKRELAEIGQTGEKAFAQVKDAVENAQSNLARVSTAVAELGKQTGKVAAAGRSFGDAITGLDGALGRFGEALTASMTRAGALAASTAAAGAGLVGLAKSAVAVADEIGKQSQALGVTVQSYQRLQFAAAQAGVTQEQFAGGIARFSRAITEAAKEQDKTARATAENLKKIGIALSPAALAERALSDAATAAAKRQADLNLEVIRGGVSSKRQAESVEESSNALVRFAVGVKDAKGNIRPLEQILGDLAERFAKLPDGPQKTAAAMELFGRAAGPRMIPLLNQGRAGMQAVMGQAERMGLFVTREQAKIAEGMNDALSFMAAVARGARTQIGLVFAPVITRAADAFREAIARNWTTLQGLARDIETRIAPIIDDLIRLLEGRDAEVNNKSILAARDAVVSFGRDTRSTLSNIIVPAFKTLRVALSGIADIINLVFGSHLTAAQVALAIAAARFLGLFRAVSAAVSVAAASVRVLIAGLALVAQNFGLIVAAGRAVLVLLAGLAGWPALIVAALIAAGVLIVTFWDDIKVGASAAVGAIAGIFQSGWEFIAQGFAAIVGAVESAWETIKSSATGLWQTLSGLFSAGVRAIAAFFANLPTAVSAVMQAMVAAVGALLGSISQTMAAAFNAVSERLASLADAVRGAWNGLFDWFGGKIDGLLQWFERLIERARAFIGLAGQAASEGGTAGFARGGPVFGSGTATSDSIPAWLSSGEFVIRAAAVQKYGAGLFHALNRMRLPQDAFKFALGGLVEALAPQMMPVRLPARLADGGSVRSSMRPVNLNILGQQFNGLLAPDEVADKLVRFAMGRQIGSGGRKPSWYGR